MTDELLLDARGVTKAYPGVQALAGVDFMVHAGEVHALLGENGAGKSTLMKVIAGSVVPDRADITLFSEPLPLGDPQAVRDRGVGAVYQELSLIESMTVAENVLLGNWPVRRAGRLDRAGMREEARRRLGRIGLDIDLDVRIRHLGVATRQLIELAKSLGRDTRVLLLDEPTSALSDPEARQLFDVIGELRDDGVGIVYVSHRLPEIMRICDQVTVLRDGRYVATLPIHEVDENRLARLMLGRAVALEAEGGDTTDRVGRSREPALVARRFGRPPRLKPLNLEVGRGEIVAIFGLVGAGRTRLANALFGIEPATTGELEVLGEPRVIGAPSDAIGAGMGYLGESRSIGLVPAFSVAANITLASLPRIRRGPRLDRTQELQIAEGYIDQLNIDVSGPHQRTETLSGGNQQKALLARALCSEIQVLVLDDPTRGIDVGAKQEVFRLVRELADSGVAILYLTSEIKEARALADRLLVMSNGALVEELDADASDDEVMAAAGGVHG